MNSGTIAKVIIAAVILLPLPMAQVYAATITTGASCSLSDALDSAIDNSDTGGCVATGTYGNDTINMHAGATLNERKRWSSETITINGNGHTIPAPASGRRQAFTIWATSGITLNNLTLTGANHTAGALSTSDVSGGTQTVNFNRVRVCGNRSPAANSAVLLAPTTTATITSSVFCNNAGATHSDGPLHCRGCTLTIDRSVFYGNRSSGSAAAANLSGTITITNSVFYDNRLTGGRLQGGVLKLGRGTITIRNSTFTRNHANEGHAIFIIPAAHANSITLQNNLVYGNAAGTAACRSNSSNAVNTSASTGNLFESSQNCGTPVSTANPDLIDRTSASPLPHYAVGAGSPAVDAANCVAGVTRDLRGILRPQGSRCDIGAIEFVQRPSSLTLSADRVPSEGGGDVTVTATLDRPWRHDVEVAFTLNGTATWGGSETRTGFSPTPDYWTPIPEGARRYTWFDKDADRADCQATGLFLIPAGRISARFPIRVIDDTHPDAGETIVIEASLQRYDREDGADRGNVHVSYLGLSSALTLTIASDDTGPVSEVKPIVPETALLYDASGDGAIDHGEYLQAARDYAADKITHGALMPVVEAYRAFKATLRPEPAEEQPRQRSPLTASFEREPSEHDGKESFWLNVRFSEAPGGGFTATPHAGFGLSDTARDWRLTPAGTGATGFELSFDATRREAAGHTPIKHDVMLGARTS